MPALPLKVAICFRESKARYFPSFQQPFVINARLATDLGMAKNEGAARIFPYGYTGILLCYIRAWAGLTANIHEEKMK